MKEAHDRARAGEGPTLIECKTYRFLRPHLRRRRQVLPLARRGRGGAPPRPDRDASPPTSPSTRLIDTHGDRRAPGRGQGGDRRRDRDGLGRSRPRSANRDAPRVRRGATSDREERRHGDPRRPARRDGRRRARRAARRGRRDPRRGLPGLRRVHGRVRRAAGDRHAAGRVRDRRRGDRDGAARDPAGRRDRVRGLHPPGVRPDRVRGRADALPDERRLRRARW